MWDLYWIQRLGAINTACIPILVVSLIVTLSLLASYYYNITEYIKYRSCRSYRNDAVEAKGNAKVCSKLLKISIPVAIISLMGLIFIPTTKEAYMVWGVGSTIDYLKSNDTAKKLPDKAIKALDKWADSFLESKEENSEEPY